MNLQIQATHGLEQTRRLFRYSTLFAVCACALILALPKSIAEPRFSAGHHGAELNGFKLNGFKLNGFKLNNIRLNNIRLSGDKLNVSALNTAHADSRSDAGLVAGSANLVGITLPNGERISQ